MTDACFKAGMLALTAAFPGQVFNMNLYKNILSDLDDVDFQEAIKIVIKEVKDIFPGTNLIGIIRGHANDHNKTRSLKRRKIMDQRCDPPGPEWEELKKRLGISNNLPSDS